MTSSSQSAQPYHRIYVVAPDVIALSGRDAFTHFTCHTDGSRNLVVIPMDYVEALHQDRDSGNGAGDALRFLKREVRDNGGLSPENISLGHVSPGLDIAIAHRTGKEKRGGFSAVDLERRISRNFKGKHRGVTFVTRDERAHIELRARNIQVEDPHFLQVSADIVHEGVITGSSELQARLAGEDDSLPLRDAVELLGRDLRLHQIVKFPGAQPQYARVRGNLVWSRDRERVVDVKDLQLRMLAPAEGSKRLHVGNHVRDDILGIRPRDMEQYLALQDGLLNEDVRLFFLCGSQGSGKTLLAYVAAVDLVLWYDKGLRERRGLDENQGNGGGFYKYIVLLKPNEIMGGARRDVGALPGTLFDKMSPHLAPYVDAHEESVLGSAIPFEQMLYHPRFEQDGFPARGKEYNERKIGGNSHLPGNSPVFRMTYSGFMRGRSFRNALIIVDEAQNFTPYEMRTIAERAAEGSKVIVMGDPLQTDNPQCSTEINGLTHAIQHYLHRPYAALVTLPRNYRSQVSDDAREWRTFRG